jgi:DNA polymerase III epsilon subunit-like protein
MRIAVVDTETTGIPERHPFARVVEVGAVICDWTETGIVEVAAFESLARPSGDEHRLPGAAGALKFNGLTVEQIDKAPLDWQVGQALEAFIVNHGVAAIGAFNDPFDFDPMLLGSIRWLARLLRTTPHLPDLMTHEKMGLEPYSRGGRLVDCIRRFGLPLLDAHCALADARMAASLVPKVLDLAACSKLRGVPAFVAVTR